MACGFARSAAWLLVLGSLLISLGGCHARNHQSVPAVPNASVVAPVAPVSLTQENLKNDKEKQRVASKAKAQPSSKITWVDVLIEATSSRGPPRIEASLYQVPGLSVCTMEAVVGRYAFGVSYVDGGLGSRHESWVSRRFRYYDPAIGRYISRDPIGYGDGPNVYLYVHNNPINRIDPVGLADLGDVVNFFIPRPDESFKAADEGFKAMIAPGASAEERISGGLSFIGNAIGTVTDLVPGKSGAKKALLGAVEKSIKSGAENLAERELKQIAKAEEKKLATKSAEEGAFDAGKKLEGEKKVPNPNGQHGKEDHRETVKELRQKAEEEFPGDLIQEGKSIKPQTGINRRPDVSALDRETGEVKKVYEAARTNKDGSIVKREALKQEQYNAADIPSHFEPVKPKDGK